MLRRNRRSWLLGGVALCALAGALVRLANAQTRIQPRGANNYQATGTNSVPRTIASKLGDIVSVTDYGAKGDCTTPDDTAFTTALAAAKRVYVPNPGAGSCYLITSTIAIPADTALVGENKRATKIQIGANVDLFTMADGARLENVYLEGVGATFTTARAVVISGTAGRQAINHCRLANWGGFAIEFTSTTAGSQFAAVDSEIWSTLADFATHPTIFSVKIQDAVQLAAVPRKFIGIETSGQQFIDFGGANDAFVTDSFIGGLNFTTNTRGVLVTNTRIANQTALTVNGHNNVLVGNDILPALTIASGSDHIAIGYNSLNADVVTDASTASTMVTSTGVLYTPTLTAATTNPTIGNGSLRGEYSRNGSVIHAIVEYTVGSTDTPGSGAWRFALPVTRVGQSGAPQVQVGHGYVRQNSTSTFEFVLPTVTNNVGYVVLSRAGAGGLQVTNAAPWAWAAGDIVRFTIDYNLF